MDSQRRTDRIDYHVSVEERADTYAEAKRMGIAVSEFVRRCVRHNLEEKRKHARLLETVYPQRKEK